MLGVGEQAPDFTLEDEAGNRVTLSEFRGRPVVLIFYPGDATPVCTAQLCEVRDQLAEFAAAGAQVLGLNPFGAASHRRFSQRHGFQFPLLIDRRLHVARAYDAVLGWGPIAFVNRTVYVVGPDGIIRYARRGKPSPAEVLRAVRECAPSASV